jgi:hypothetical protein
MFICISTSSLLTWELMTWTVKPKTIKSNNNKERKLGHLKQQHLICESRGNKKNKKKELVQKTKRIIA